MTGGDLPSATLPTPPADHARRELEAPGMLRSDMPEQVQPCMCETLQWQIESVRLGRNLTMLEVMPVCI